MASTSLFFDIFARDQGVERTLNNIGDTAERTDGRFGKFGTTMSNLAAPAAIGLGAVGALALKFGDMAAEAEQNVGAVETVFGKAAGKVQEFADKSATAVGMSESSYNQLSATTGTALKAAGVSFDELAEKNDMLITRGADLASLFGGTTAEAVQAMGSAFRGEFDPLERYGLTLNMNTVNAKLAEKGLTGLTGAALEQAKKQEILNLIMEQSSQAAGNFARESDTTAGAQQRATASFADASAKLGEKLLPAMTKLAEIATTVATWVAENSNLVGGLTVALAALAGGIVVANGVMTIMNIVMAANPIGAVILAVTALIAVIVLLSMNWDNVTRFITEKWNGLTGWWSDGMGKIGRQWSQFWTDTGNNARNTWNGTIGPVFDTIKRVVTEDIPNAFRNGVDWIGIHWRKLEGIVKAPVKFLIDTVINGGLIGAFNTVAGWINIGKINPVRIPGFAGGGYTGDGDKHEPKGVVHGGEFVFTKEETSRAGVGTLAQLAKSLRGYALGGFVNPLPGALRLTQGYNRVHKGIDLAAGVGTPVYAIADGVVRMAGPGARAPGVWGGNEIHVMGAGNIEQWYAHLSRFAVGAGQRVKAGQQIASSGNTGISSGPHLHLGMFRGGWPNDINPLMFLGGGKGIPGGAGNSDSGVFNPVAMIADGLLRNFRGAFGGGNIVADLAIGTGKKLLGEAGGFIMKQLGMGATTFDQGGWLDTVGVNRSGRPEPVLTATQWDDIHRLAARGASFNLDGYTLELNADATKATFRRIATETAESVMETASDDIYRGRAR